MSSKVGNVMVMFVALIHAGVAVVEMFFWKEPWAHERLNQLLTSSDVAIKAAPIVTNAGLYNGFIAVGLVWGLRARGGARIQVFFACLCCCCRNCRSFYLERLGASRIANRSRGGHAARYIEVGGLSFIAFRTNFGF